MEIKVKDAVKLLSTLAEIYPDAKLTFANNKVDVSTIVYDAKTNSVNIR